MKPNFAARSIRWGLPLFVSSTLALAVGCGAGDAGSNGGAGAGVGTGSTGSGAGNGTSTGGGIDFGSGGTGQNGTGGDRPSECEVDPTTGTKTCVCISVATWGALGAFGLNPGSDGSDAISDWLNKNSTGDAAYFATKPAVTAEELAKVDVIIVQDISAWSFTADEKAAFEAWVRGGGGVITLNGYSANGNEMTVVNDLIAFSGMSYIPSTDTSPTSYADCGYCLGNSDKQMGFSTTNPIAANVTAVGAFHGRAVTGDGDIVAQVGSDVLGMSKQIDSGRVFVFHDEWITYNSQWNGSGLDSSCYATDNSCYGKSSDKVFQIPQFWYNSLKWSSGDPACFTIEDPVIIK